MPVRVEVEGLPPLAVFQLDDGSSTSPTTPAPMAGVARGRGFVEGDEIECPWHSGKFCIQRRQGDRAAGTASRSRSTGRRSSSTAASASRGGLTPSERPEGGVGRLSPAGRCPTREGMATALSLRCTITVTIRPSSMLSHALVPFAIPRHCLARLRAGAGLCRSLRLARATLTPRPSAMATGSSSIPVWEPARGAPCGCALPLAAAGFDSVDWGFRPEPGPARQPPRLA